MILFFFKKFLNPVSLFKFPTTFFTIPPPPRYRLGSYQGGTAIYFKHHIPHYPVQQTLYTGLNYAGIVVQLPQINIHFISLYVRHSRFFSVNDLTELFSQNTHCSIAGVYNAHNTQWDCSSSTRRSSSLDNLITHLDLSTCHSYTHRVW